MSTRHKIYFDELQPRFRLLVQAWIKDNNTDQKGLAKRLKMVDPDLSDLLNGRKRLSDTYLQKFLTGGIVLVGELRGGSNLNEEQSLFLDNMEVYQEVILDRTFIKTVMEIKRLGHDPRLALKNFLVILNSEK